jgi:hypothetical protein
MRIFGDVRAFECSQCGFMALLDHPFQLTQPGQACSSPKLDAVE